MHTFGDVLGKVNLDTAGLDLWIQFGGEGSWLLGIKN